MFVDHQLTESAGEEEMQINPSAKDFVSTTQNVRFDPDYECQMTDGKGAIVGEAKIFDQGYRARMTYPEFRGNIGLSHCILAVWDAAEEDGQSVQVATEMEVESIDWVMNPAQGGRVLEHKLKEEGMSGYEEKLKDLERKQRSIETRAAAQMIVQADESLTPKLRQKIVEMVSAVQDKAPDGIDIQTVTEAAIADMRDTINEAIGPARPGVSSRHSVSEFTGMNQDTFKDGAAVALCETIFSI